MIGSAGVDVVVPAAAAEQLPVGGPGGHPDSGLDGCHGVVLLDDDQDGTGDVWCAGSGPVTRNVEQGSGGDFVGPVAGQHDVVAVLGVRGGNEAEAAGGAPSGM